jgi:DME family drug/metabolite transporter
MSILQTPTRTVGVISVLGAATLFGTSAAAVTLVGPSATAPVIAAGRLIVGAAGLIVLVVLTLPGRAALMRLWRRPVVWFMGLAVASYQTLFFLGVARTGVAVGTLASLALAPFLAGVLGWWLKEGAPGVIWAVSTLLAVTGMALLTLGDGQARDLVGIVAAMGAGASYAVFTVLGVRLARDGESATHVLAAAFSLAAIVTIPVFVTAGLWWWNPQGIVLLVWLGLAATTVAYLLFGVGLRTLQPGHIATLNLAEPVVATLLGVVILGEVLGVRGWFGCGLIVIALAILGVSDRGRNSAPPRDHRRDESIAA